MTPPHYPRIRTLLGALDAPVVELLGWPGSGKRSVLAALLAEDPGAGFVPAAWLREPERLEERLRTDRAEATSLLLDSESAADLDAVAAVAALLRPGQRLLVASDTRLELGSAAMATPPSAMLLRPDEIGVLWRRTCGRTLTPAECEWLERRSDGWLLPLALWASDPDKANARFDDDGRFTFDAVSTVVRDRMLGCCDPDEADLARELARRGRASWSELVASDLRTSGRRESLLRGMIERLGWPRVDGDELYLPRAIQEHFAVEERRRGRLGLPAPLPMGEVIAEVQPAPISGASARAAPAVLRSDWREERVEIAPDVRIGLLGVPRVERRDGTGAMVPVSWSYKRPLRILAYLASAPDLQASREEIVSILWPESSEEAIRRNLHPAMSWLRRSVWPGGGPRGVVLLRDGVYSLDPALHWEVDVRVFLERIENGARHLARGRTQEAEASWEAAWRLYQGAFLQGWSERWVLEQRDELQLRFTHLLRRLGDLKAQLGRLAEAEDAYRTLLIEDPLEESVHVAIMRIYATRGRRDLVNRQYQRLRQVLLQELGVEPSPPTLEVFNELMRTPAQRR